MWCFGTQNTHQRCLRQHVMFCQRCLRHHDVMHDLVKHVGVVHDLVKHVGTMMNLSKMFEACLRHVWGMVMLEAWCHDTCCCVKHVGIMMHAWTWWHQTCTTTLLHMQHDTCLNMRCSGTMTLHYIHNDTMMPMIHAWTMYNETTCCCQTCRRHDTCLNNV